MKLQIETLESRRVCASDWQNSQNPLDADRSGLVDIQDVQVLFDDLNSIGPRAAGVLPSNYTGPLCDVNGDGVFAPLDVLLVVYNLHRYRDPLFVESSLASQVDIDGNGVVAASMLAGGTTTLTGATLPGSAVSLFKLVGAEEQFVGRTTADGEGAFQFEVTPSGPIAQWKLVAQDPLGRTEPMLRTTRHGDVIAQWNSTFLDVMRTTRIPSLEDPSIKVRPAPPLVARNLAIMHLAMFDAINAIESDYESYLWRNSMAPDLAVQQAATSVAASFAAYRVASTLFPSAADLARWEACLDESLRGAATGQSRTVGEELGKRVADAILAERSSDRSNQIVPYVPDQIAGAWQPTPPSLAAPLLPQWPQVVPFSLLSGSQFRPEPPPALTSTQYAMAVDEVMQLGEAGSLVRTPEQTEIALYWADGPGTATPPGHWNRIAIDIGLTKSVGLLENARTMALLNMALADAGIASWDAKYHYDFWRPVTAIREANRDGNSATTADSDWTPLIATPPFPAYTSGHSTFSGAAAKVLSVIYGDNTSFASLQDPGAVTDLAALDESTLVQRRFNSFSAAAAEAGLSRIYGGIHYSFDNSAGLASGDSVAQWVVSRELKLL